jgi:hypothetical protein
VGGFFAQSVNVKEDVMIATQMTQGTDGLEDSVKKTQRVYRSRKGALVWSFSKSRDNWKAKHAEVKGKLDASERRLKYALRVKEAAAVEIAAIREELAAEKAKAADLATQLAESLKKRVARFS